MTRPQDAAPRPPARLILTTPEHLVAFGFGAGLSPRGPGTLGTLWGVLLFAVLSGLSPLAYGLVLAALTAFGIWICGRSATLLGVHDSPGIVFDEIVGFLVTCMPLLPALHLKQGYFFHWLAGAFILFRFFDVLKPWPIRGLERRLHGGFGIMLDDVLAGVYAGALLAIATWLVPKG